MQNNTAYAQQTAQPKNTATADRLGKADRPARWVADAIGQRGRKTTVELVGLRPSAILVDWRGYCIAPRDYFLIVKDTKTGREFSNFTLSRNTRDNSLWVCADNRRGYWWTRVQLDSIRRL